MFFLKIFLVFLSSFLSRKLGKKINRKINKKIDRKIDRKNPDKIQLKLQEKTLIILYTLFQGDIVGWNRHSDSLQRLVKIAQVSLTTEVILVLNSDFWNSQKAVQSFVEISFQKLKISFRFLSFSETTKTLLYFNLT